MTFKYDSPKTEFYTIDSSNDIWFMTDGYKLVPRAAIEISEKCPSNLISVIRQAINCGYIEPIAYLSGKDYLWATLEK